MKTFIVTLYFKGAPVLEDSFEANTSTEAKGMARRSAIEQGWKEEVIKLEIKRK
tara:strand:+ start:33262 stop:33423 length:162 start_codon:yes stop_codon:yes gene_type:complete